VAAAPVHPAIAQAIIGRRIISLTSSIRIAWRLHEEMRDACQAVYAASSSMTRAAMAVLIRFTSVSVLGKTVVSSGASPH